MPKGINPNTKTPFTIKMVATSMVKIRKDLSATPKKTAQKKTSPISTAPTVSTLKETFAERTRICYEDFLISQLFY